MGKDIVVPSIAKDTWDHVNLRNGYTTISAGVSITISVTGSEAMIVIDLETARNVRVTGTTLTSKTVDNNDTVSVFVGWSALIKP